MRVKPGKATTYRDAGVDIDAGRRAVDLFREHVRATYRPEVLGDLGGFAGAFALDRMRFKDPVLLSATDGAGTKVMIAQQMGIHDTIGIDLVAMSVNDVAAHGGEPLFFLDYVVTDRAVPEILAEIVKGVAHGCKEAGCALIGGEVAEHPGHLPDGSYDLAGFCVGVVDRDQMITGEGINVGDILIGIESSGLHSNGFSLVRKVLLERMGLRLDDRPIELSGTLGETLLSPTFIYSEVVRALLEDGLPKGIAHITGGGMPENVGRILPVGLRASIDSRAWEAPGIFGLISSLGHVDKPEMFSTFNMGVGMVVVVASGNALKALDRIRSRGFVASEIGVVEKSDAPPIVQIT